jgi:hypothetical protein
MYLGEVRYSKLKGQPHVHLHMSDLEYSLCGNPRKIIVNLAEFYELKILNREYCEIVKKLFDKGLYYVKIEIDE